MRIPPPDGRGEGGVGRALHQSLAPPGRGAAGCAALFRGFLFKLHLGSVLRGVRRPYFLAGGLTPENVGAAIRQLRPYGVDVSSGVETEGYKDPDKMARFLRACRETEEQP